MSIYGINEDSEDQAISVDSESGAIVSITNDHHKINSGKKFCAFASSDAAASLNISLKTPATGAVHLVASFASESKAHLTIEEGGSWTTNTGTVFAPINKDRNSSSTSGLLEDKTATPAFTAGGVLVGVTSPSGGDIVMQSYSFGERQSGMNSGSQCESDEIVLEAGQTYSIILTSDDGSKGLHLYVEWYE